VRAPNGKITEFDVPGAGKTYSESEDPLEINPAGVIAGFFVDARNVYHGFLRLP